MGTKTLQTIRHDEVRVGDLVRSSHGYDLHVTRVLLCGSDTVQLDGELHGPGGAKRTQRYSRATPIEVVKRAPTITVEVTIQVEVAAEQWATAYGFESDAEVAEDIRDLLHGHVNDVPFLRAGTATFRPLWHEVHP